MAGSIIWRIVGIVLALALGWWILTRTTVSLVVNYGFQQEVSSAPVAPAQPTPEPPAVPAAPATGRAAPQVSSDTKLIMEAMERMDLRNQAQNAKQDERLDEFGRRLDALSSGPPTPPLQDCPAGCVTGVQKLSAR